MKKLLFILVAIFALCACSSNDDSNESGVSNVISYDGKNYAVNEVELSSYMLAMGSNDNALLINNCKLEVGKKNYLSGYERVQALFATSKEDGTSEVVHQWENTAITKDSYVTIKKNDEDNRTYIEVYINDGKKKIKATYLGTISEDNNNNPPAQNESEYLLNIIKGNHSCGILFPALESENIKKDSIGNLSCDISVVDDKGSLTVKNYPVKYFAKYIKDETIGKEVSALPEQDLSIQIIPYDVLQQMFLTVPKDITYTNSEGKQVKIQFYGGATNYSIAQVGTRKDNGKKELLVYLTPGRILVDGVTKDALKTYSYQGNNYPYVISLEALL